MPADVSLDALVLNASLKHKPDSSNTDEVANLVIDSMKQYCPITSEILRLSDMVIPVGLGFKESGSDEWPAVVKKMKKADIVIFATPIWWGQRSSLMQRVMERMDALDEEYRASNRSALLNKVAGIVVTGSEDGAQQVIASIMEVLTFMNFTLPPECAAYWVGEVGLPSNTDAERRRKNEAVSHMAKNMARNLVYYSQLLKQHPLKPQTKASE